MRKIFLSIVSLLLIISLVGCSTNNDHSQGDEQNADVNSNHLTLAYCFNDVVNPYKAKTIPPKSNANTVKYRCR